MLQVHYDIRFYCSDKETNEFLPLQERMWVRNQNSVANLNTIAHIALLSIAIAAVITNKDCSVRSRKALFLSA